MVGDRVELFLAFAQVQGQCLEALRTLLPQRWPQFRAGLLDYSVFADQQSVLREHERLPEDGRVAILPPVSGG